MKKCQLTLNGEDNLRLHGFDADLVHGLAAVPRVVVLRRGHERVHVAALTTGRRVRKVDLENDSQCCIFTVSIDINKSKVLGTIFDKIKVRLG